MPGEYVSGTGVGWRGCGTLVGRHGRRGISEVSSQVACSLAVLGRCLGPDVPGQGHSSADERILGWRSHFLLRP